MKSLLTTGLGFACLTMLLSSSFAQDPKQEKVTKKVDVPVVPKTSVLDKTEVAPPVLAEPKNQQATDPVVVGPQQLVPGSVSFHSVPNCCCDPCCNDKVDVALCLTDCDCCVHKVCVRIPCSCCNHLPTVKWRDGILGRKIAILCWECCDYSVKVIVNRCGDVRVRYHFLIG